MANPYQDLDSGIFAVGNLWSSSLDLLFLKRDYGIVERPFNFTYVSESHALGSSPTDYTDLSIWFPDNIEEDDELGTLTTTIHLKLEYTVTNGPAEFRWTRSAGSGGTETSGTYTVLSLTGWTYSLDYDLTFTGMPRGEQTLTPQAKDTTATGTLEIRRRTQDYRSGDCYVKVDLA